MNSKLIVSILVGGIIILVVGAVIFLNKQSGSNMSPEAIKIPSHKDITVSALKADPEQVTIQTGSVVRFINSSSQNINIDISGPSAFIIVGKDKELVSPVFTKPGNYKFVDKENSGISGTIIVEGQDILNENENKSGLNSENNNGKLTHYYTDVVISTNGFSPSVLHEKSGVIVRVKNSTSSSVKIKGGQTDFGIPSGQTSSLNFDSPGEFNYINEANKGMSLSITVQ